MKSQPNRIELVSIPAGSRWMAMDHTLDLIEHFVVVTAENEDSSAAGPEACVTDPAIFCCSFEPLDPSALLSTVSTVEKIWSLNRLYTVSFL